MRDLQEQFQFASLRTTSPASQYLGPLTKQTPASSSAIIPARRSVTSTARTSAACVSLRDYSPARRRGACHHAGAVKANAAPQTNVVAPHRMGALSLSLLRWLCLPVHPWL